MEEEFKREFKKFLDKEAIYPENYQNVRDITMAEYFFNKGKEHTLTK